MTVDDHPVDASTLNVPTDARPALLAGAEQCRRHAKFCREMADIIQRGVDSGDIPVGTDVDVDQHIARDRERGDLFDAYAATLERMAG